MTMSLGESLTVRAVLSKDADTLGTLFDAYRVFYEAPSDRAASRAFVCERLTRGDSVILVAEAHDGERVHAVGRALMRAADSFARADGVNCLQLETAHVKKRAQALYELRLRAQRRFRVYVKAF